MAEKEKIDWNQAVADSNGSRVFLPDAFVARAEELQKMRKEFNELISQVAEKELRLRTFGDVLMFDVREHLAGAGMPTWTKDIGFEESAIKDGKFVVNLRENQR